MKIYEHPIQYYIDRINRNEYFSFAGYSDAEWFCMIGIRMNEHTGLGQKITKEHGVLLLDVMRRRANDNRFLFAIPKCLWNIPLLRKNKIDRYLMHRGIEIEGYERDMVTDDLARDAGLYSFIKCLQDRNVTIIGNKSLEPHLEFLNWERFIEIESPNLHLTPGLINNAVDETLSYCPDSQVYLVSAGVSAAVIIDRLHDKIPNSFFIDCGSIWDAFAGIGGQREWRKQLYADQAKWDQWKKENLDGRAIDEPGEGSGSSVRHGGSLQ